MKESDAYIHDAESITNFQSLQEHYNNIRAYVVKEFDDTNAEKWNTAPIGLALRKISELLLNFKDKIENKKPIYLASFFYTLNALTNFSNLLQDTTFTSKSKIDKLKELNTGADEFLNGTHRHAHYALMSSTIQMAIAIRDTDETKFADLKNSMTNLYPSLSKLLRETRSDE